MKNNIELIKDFTELAQPDQMLVVYEATRNTQWKDLLQLMGAYKPSEEGFTAEVAGAIAHNICMMHDQGMISTEEQVFDSPILIGIAKVMREDK